MSMDIQGSQLADSAFLAGQLHSQFDNSVKPFDFGHGSGQQSVFGSGSGIFSDQSGAILSTGSGTLSDSFMGLASNNAPRQDFQSVLDERDQLRAQLMQYEQMLQLLQQQQTAQLEMKRNEQLARSMMMPGQPVQAMVSIPMNPNGIQEDAMTLLDDDEYPFPRFTVTESTVRPYPVMVIHYDGPKNNLLVKAEPADGYKFKIENHIAYFKPKDQEYTGGRKLGDVIVFELLHVMEVGNAEGEPVQIDFSLYLIDGPNATLLSRKRSPPIIVFNHSQYLPAPSITKLLPSWAPAGAAPKVDAFGPLFLRKNNILECQVAELDGRQCRMLGGTEIVRKRNNFHSFSFTAPQHPAGSVMVRSRYKGREFGAHRNFEYIQPPTLHIRGAAVGANNSPGGGSGSGGDGAPVAVPSRVLLAAYTGQLEILSSVLQENKNAANDRDRYGFTPLMWASLTGSVDAVRLLINAGADVNATNNRNETALHMACYGRHTSTVQLLVKHGAKSTVRSYIDGFLPIHVAAYVGPVEILRAVIEEADNTSGDALQDAELAVVDRDGMTALHLAVLGGHLDNVQLLVEHYAQEGLSLTQRDSAGMTSFMWACSMDNLDMCRAILNSLDDVSEKRELINVRNGDGESALFLAVRHADNTLTQLLLDSGADVGIKNHRGQLPFEALGDIDVSPLVSHHNNDAQLPIKMHVSDVDELSPSARGEIVPFEITTQYGVQMLEHVAKVKSNSKTPSPDAISFAASATSTVSEALLNAQFADDEDDENQEGAGADEDFEPLEGDTAQLTPAPAPAASAAVVPAPQIQKPAPVTLVSPGSQQLLSISTIARETADSVIAETAAAAGASSSHPVATKTTTEYVTPGNPALKLTDDVVELQLQNSDLVRKMRIMQELMEERERSYKDKLAKSEQEIQSLREALAALRTGQTH